MFSVLQITVYFVHAKKCETDFVITVMNIWSNVLFLGCQKKNCVRLYFIILAIIKKNVNVNGYVSFAWLC